MTLINKVVRVVIPGGTDIYGEKFATETFIGTVVKENSDGTVDVEKLGTDDIHGVRREWINSELIPESVHGWIASLKNVQQQINELDEEASRYIQQIEEATGVDVDYILGLKEGQAIEAATH